MGASFTLAGEDLIAQKQAAKQTLTVSRFILANVPGLNPNGPVDRAAGKPAAAQIIDTYPVTQAGYVNPSQVVYSLMLGSDIGDFDWNWVGLESAEGVLLMVAYVPLQQKRRNIPPLQLGNNVTRNFLLKFDGAQELTGVTIDANTWQHDFTVRLAGIDDRERLANRDVFGRACFFGSALQLEKVGSAYQLKPGTAYVEGVRLQSAAPQLVVPPALPATAWLDVALQRELSDVVATWSVVWGAGKADYLDSAGAQHYCVPIADLVNANTITDRRPVENIAGPLVSHFAARVGDYAGLRARATTKEDVGLGNLPNAKSDDENTDSSLILATTKAVKAASAVIWTAIANIVSGATTVGKASKLATPRLIALSGDATGSATFDGSGNVDIEVTNNENTLYRRNLVTDGACRSAQLAAKSLTNSAQYGAVDMFAAWAGGSVSAGSITQGLGALGQQGSSLQLSGVTLTGAGAVYSRHRIEAANAIELKDKVASLSLLVLHDVGVAVNYTLTLRKANAADNFTAVTQVATSAAISVPTGAATLLRLDGVAMTDCANGIEIEVVANCGAVTNRNFHFTDWQLERGAKATRFASEPLVATHRAVERYLEKSYDRPTMPGTVTMNGATVGDASHVSDVTVCFRERKRTIPTITYYSALTGARGVIAFSNTQLESSPSGNLDVRFSRASENNLHVESLPGDGYMPIVHFVADARL